MDLYSYDNALIDKLTKVFPNVINCSDDKVLSYSEDDDEENNVSLPMISFWRLNSDFNLENFNYSGTMRGRPMTKLNNTKGLNIQEIPINLIYQIDLWSDRRYEVDQLYKELLFYLIQEPYLNVLCETDMTVRDFYFKITDTNTSIELAEFNDNGKIYRQIITIECDSAVLGVPVEKDLINKFEIRTVILNTRDEEFSD